MHPTMQIAPDDLPVSSGEAPSESPASISPGPDSQSEVHTPAQSIDEHATTKPRQRSLSPTRLPGWLPVWVPILASLVSLVISIYTLFIATAPPEVLLIVPQQVRIAQVSSKHDWATIYLQTTFVSTGINQRAEVIPGMRINVKPPTSDTVSFEWIEQGVFKFEPDPNTPGSTMMYAHTADALPLLVSPNNGQAPVAEFRGPVGWAFQAGTYEMTLVADRAVSGKPLSQAFKVTIPQSDIEAWQGYRDNFMFLYNVEK